MKLLRSVIAMVAVGSVLSGGLGCSREELPPPLPPSAPLPPLPPPLLKSVVAATVGAFESGKPNAPINVVALNEEFDFLATIQWTSPPPKNLSWAIVQVVFPLKDGTFAIAQEIGVPLVKSADGSWTAEGKLTVLGPKGKARLVVRINGEALADSPVEVR